MENIIIATIKEWNRTNFYELKKRYEKQFNFILIQKKEELTLENLKKLEPKFIFFPHWSWIIPQNIYTAFECIVFHMTDLPFGRGGSPLQNLIQREIYQTKISALKVDGGLDTGDIYLKEDFDISKGSAHILYMQASDIIFKKMIPTLLTKIIIPMRQDGDAVTFTRRDEKQSNLLDSNIKNIHQLYDFIRMLDAPNYPKANIAFGNLKMRFKDAKLENGKLSGTFEVIENE